MTHRFRFHQAAAALVSLTIATTTAAASSQQSYVLDGEILVYPARVSGLPASTRMAPQGARSESEQLLTVQSITTASEDFSKFESGALVHGSRPLVLGEGSGSPLTVGDLSLQFQDGRWSLFGLDGDLKGRPIYSITPESASITRLSDLEFTLTGELVLDETMADELGLQPMLKGTGLIVGAVTLHGAGYPGVTVSTPVTSTTSQPTVATSALSVAGPDVIVSTIGSALSEYGVVGTIGGYAVTTVSCNIGTQDAEWFAPTAHHPVIGTQFYRLKTVNGATRFEGIGMSWLKHGFCAADASNCGQTPTPNGSCDWLGLWSTDTYGSGLNATQSNCGPRSEVNAWTGVYTYPYVLGSGTGNPGGIYKRCQIEQSDVDPAQNSGAQYVGEVVYICTDEPDANKYNNYSYRDVTVVSQLSGQWNLEFAATTVREQPAIQRWASLDTGVTLVNVDVPGDGRFVVGAKTTNLGGGLYHYEYAVLNMNCHDSARLFRVPASSSVTVTNVGFHDVPYHSGEPYSGTDWAPSRTSTNQEWSTSTFASNPNANALRWSTLYNFRFDADAPPVSGNITLGLFRSGGNATAVGLPVPGIGGPTNTAFCFGDGLGTACPCGNSSAPAGTAGCANSTLLGGTLATTGTPSLAADTLALVGGGMPGGSPALYFQGTSQNGTGTAFGDGLLCVGGTITRLGVVFNNGSGGSQYPSGAAPAISVQGLIGAPGVRTYQAWYRDGNSSFCTTATYNLSNGYQAVWVP